MTAALLHLGQDMFSRELFLVSLQSWNDWPRELDLPSDHFCLLLVGDAYGESDETIGSLADAALDDGCVYLCAWGPDCERVHDLFDTKIVDRDMAREIPNSLSVMTTSHRGETLDEATEFLTTTAWPDAAFVETCRSALIAVVGDTSWVASIGHQFGKQPSRLTTSGDN
jgi:hypothetical protein